MKDTRPLKILPIVVAIMSLYYNSYAQELKQNKNPSKMGIIFSSETQQYTVRVPNGTCIFPRLDYKANIKIPEPISAKRDFRPWYVFSDRMFQNPSGFVTPRDPALVKEQESRIKSDCMKSLKNHLNPHSKF